LSKVVIINGAAECGKDELIKFIQEEYNDYQIMNISTIDPSKAALKILGWDGTTKNEETRQAMVDLKRISMKLFDGPFNYIIDLIAQDEGIYFVHCREPEEIQKFVNYYGKECRTLLVRGPRGKAFKNGSDDVVENYEYEYIINNDGTLDQLKEQSIDFAKALLK
jgi:hypothetical protein